ncbi:TetR/AcrR family transcriptional regulator [Noviherbaspirillum saxi]|uniref:TetR/AcrR family transcriptional regulator n=1 Tax=Noviherbaspirillum saxi TaxID=2320863 RepID=A0A3A3G2I3_9BURK|nr:TetR/AcrR family transcriptional regulator [Noviherbaspirillum saxi]RJF92273.1 TetR/AcrR family transcriptional regulator [Noviherbaspirillum saxi]
MDMQKITASTEERLEPPPTLGLREKSKLDKRRRIKAAARSVFVEKGYDAATTREIAALAEVGIGTLFVYAKDKRELLMMIINDDLDEVNDTSAYIVDHKAPLVDQVTAFFKVRYAYWACEPSLARPAVKETFDFLGSANVQGPETARFYARRPKILSMLTGIVKDGQESGMIADDVSADLIASLFITIYLTEVRRWLSQDEPLVEAGIARLRELLALAIRGIEPQRAVSSSHQDRAMVCLTEVTAVR